MALRPPHQALVGPPLPGPPGPPMMLPPMARAPGPPLGSMAALRPPLVSVYRELRVRGAVGREALILARWAVSTKSAFPVAFHVSAFSLSDFVSVFPSFLLWPYLSVFFFL